MRGEIDKVLARREGGDNCLANNVASLTMQEIPGPYAPEVVKNNNLVFICAQIEHDVPRKREEGEIWDCLVCNQGLFFSRGFER